MKSHAHAPATYLKHFSNEPSEGRHSILHVYNKKKQIVQHLPVGNIGIKRGFFSTEIEKFHGSFENDYDKFINILSTRFSWNNMDERIKIGVKFYLNIIFREKQIYRQIQKIYRNLDILVKKFGDDPWHVPNIIPELFYQITLNRAFPIKIQGFPNNVFITGDNPVIVDRKDFGTVYLLPITKRYIFCLGYAVNNYSGYMDIYIRTAQIIIKNVNEIIRNQAETHYLVL